MNEDNIKKRGRKPKLNNTSTSTSTSTNTSNSNSNNNEGSNIIKKKRGRKPTGKIIELNKTIINNNDYPNCIIAHLPISNKDVLKITKQNKIITENKNISIEEINININDCEAHKNNKSITLNNFNSGDLNKFCTKCEVLENKCSELTDKIKELEIQINQERHINPIINIKEHHICDVKIHNINNNKIGWMTNTDTYCWWCCHNFDNIPIGLPEKYTNDTFHLYGCFCSFSCAQSYNLNTNDNKIWERYSLLNFLKKKICDLNDIQYKNYDYISSAPPRQSLNIFGGPMTIDDFRNSLYTLTKNYNYILPPMIPLIGILEIIPQELTPTNVKIKNINNNLKLKRSKPLPSFNSNLLQLMKKT
jgi:hypothetical protein